MVVLCSVVTAHVFTPMLADGIIESEGGEYDEQRYEVPSMQ